MTTVDIVQLYKDSAKTQPIAPKTDIKAVYNNGEAVLTLADLKMTRTTTVATIAGNTDTTITLTFPSGVTKMRTVSIEGYTPTASWDTRLFTKSITFTDSSAVLSVRTQGATSQNYHIVAQYLYY